jgi:AraC family transcriptional regulator, arabinose operon regulatory protein
MTVTRSASLSIWRDRFIYTSPNFVGEESCRPACVIIIGTGGDVEIESSGNKYIGQAFLIAPNVTRTLRANTSGLYSLNVDPIHPYSRKLRELSAQQGILDLRSRMAANILECARISVDSTPNCSEMLHNSQTILGQLFPEIAGTKPLDLRIEKVASWLQTHAPQTAELKRLSDLCGLSESRLAHLFTDQVGISIRQYLLWVKMRYAAELFVRRKTLSEVAHEIGFSDSSHLSRTFTRYFALTPSYLANGKMVQLQICDAV